MAEILPIRRKTLSNQSISQANLCFFCFVDIESNAGNQRVKIEDHDPSVQSWNISDYCNPSSAPVIEEYHVIVAEGDFKI